MANIVTEVTACAKNIVKREAAAAEHRGEAKTSRELAQVEKINLYCETIAFLGSQTGYLTAKGRPNAKIGKMLKDALEVEGMKATEATRVWNNAAGATEALKKAGDLPTQATPSAVREAFGSRNIKTEADVKRLAGLDRTPSDKIEQIIDKVFGVVNKNSQVRSAKFSEAEIERLLLRIEQERDVMKATAEAREIAEKENRKVREVLDELMGA